MNNIVIYSSKPMPELEALLADIDEAEVRTININQMKDYAVVAPSLISRVALVSSDTFKPLNIGV
jgi:hypothetical protein